MFEHKTTWDRVVLWKLRNEWIVECETIWELDEMFKFLMKLSLVSTILLQSLTPVQPMQGYLMQLVSHNQFLLPRQIKLRGESKQQMSSAVFK